MNTPSTVYESDRDLTPELCELVSFDVETWAVSSETLSETGLRSLLGERAFFTLLGTLAADGVACFADNDDGPVD